MEDSAWTATSRQITFAEARAAGEEKVLLKAHREGRLIRVARGAYLSSTRTGTKSEIEAEFYRQKVIAAARRMRRPVFTAHSALALLRIPIVGAWPQEVQVMSTNRNGSARPGVVAVARRADVETDLVDGIRVTSVEFSLLQMARRALLLPALVAANAACHRPRLDPGSQRTTPQRLRVEHERLMPYRGCRRVRAVLDRVRENADSVLETVSDVAIEELGFAPPGYQQRFVISTGEVYVDFYWEGERIVGESDGDEKYRQAGGGTAAADRVIQEKRREDELRAQVNGLARWGWADAWRRAPLERTLLRAGVPRIRLPWRRT